MTAPRLALPALTLALLAAGPLRADGPKTVPQPKERMMVWVELAVNAQCSLHSELTVNGTSLGVFSATTQKDLGDLIKPGENTITLTTTPKEPATYKNKLTFSIGPVAKDKRDRLVMGPVLWSFENNLDWKLNEEKG